MTLLPQIERALIDGARKHYSRRRRATRALACPVPALAAVAAVGVVAAVAVGPAADVEREAAPPAQPALLSDVAQSAGCQFSRHTVHERDREHREGPFSPGDFATNPPTHGSHAPQAAADGIYPPGRSPELGESVHALEHGRINLQYKPGTPSGQVAQLEAIARENGGHHTLMFENNSGMDAPIAATAWGHALTCPTADADTARALRAFRDHYVDQGPERVP